MKIGIVYSSITGNTKKIAEAIASNWPDAICVPLGEAPDPAGFDLIAIGFWAKRGSADPVMKQYMSRITGKKVLTFFTLAAEPDSPHARSCAEAANQCYGADCEVLGSFWCQGALNPKIVANYLAHPEKSRHPITPERRARWEKAATHPDAQDLLNASQFAHEIGLLMSPL